MASQFAGEMLLRACRKGVNARFWYSSAVSMYERASRGGFVAAVCSEAIDRMPSRRKSNSSALRGMVVCHTRWSKASLERL